MPRQPSGAGASVRAPAPQPSSPLPPERYRALRARYNALLIALYERTDLTLREIAMLAGRTDRAVQMLVRALGCRPRNASACRPGTGVGARRAGPRPPPLNAPARRRAAEAFAAVARELAASAGTRAASEAKRTVARAERSATRTQLRAIAGAARSLRHVAATMDIAAALPETLTDAREAERAPAKPSNAPKRRSREETWLAQQRVLRAGEAQMHEAHRARDLARDLAARRKAAADAAAPPGSDADRRIDAIAEGYYAEPHGAQPRPMTRPVPRIRRP